MECDEWCADADGVVMVEEMKGKWWKFSLVILFMTCVTYTFWFIVPGIGVGFDSEVEVQITSRTEYVPGDAGQVITEVRYLLSNDPAPAMCYASVYYPNKNVLFVDQLMVNQSFGTHYYEFDVPMVEGVYEYQTSCDLGTRNVTRSKAFHVSSSFRLLNDTISSQQSFISEGTVNAKIGKTAASTWTVVSQASVVLQDYECRFYHITGLMREEVENVTHTVNVTSDTFDVLWYVDKEKFTTRENYQILCQGEDSYLVNQTLQLNATYYTLRADRFGLFENTYPSGFSISGNSCGGTFSTLKNGSQLALYSNTCANPNFNTYLNGPQNKFTWSEWLGDYAFSIVYRPFELVGNTDAGNPAKVPIYFQKTNNGSSARGFQIYIDNANAKLTVRVMGDSNQYLVYNTLMVINQTYDIVFVHRVNGTKSLYVDGVKVDENTGTMSFISAAAVPAYTFVSAAVDAWPVLIMGEGVVDNYYLFDASYVLGDAGCAVGETCGSDVKILKDLTNDLSDITFPVLVFEERVSLMQYLYVEENNRIRAVHVK